jgi:hypothetical protein
MNTTFDSGLRPESFTETKDSVDIIHKNYEYLDDGRLKYSEDVTNPIFDRLQIYDHQGRIVEAKSGAEARGQTVSTNQDTQLPYRQSFQYNPFDNLTQRNNLHWGITSWQGYSNNLSFNYSNNRVTDQYWAYDADGRALNAASGGIGQSLTYDASGLVIGMTDGFSTEVARFNGGDGREAKRKTRSWDNSMNESQGGWSMPGYWYYIRSTILNGEVVSEADSTGKKVNTSIYAGGSKIGTQSAWTINNVYWQAVTFDYSDPSGMSRRSASLTGTLLEGSGYEGAPAELDPMGENAGTSTPYINPEPPPEPNEDYPVFEVGNYEWGTANGNRVTYYVDGLWVLFPIGLTMLNNPTVQCPDNDCNPRARMVDGRATVTGPIGASGDQFIYDGLLRRTIYVGPDEQGDMAEGNYVEYWDRMKFGQPIDRPEVSIVPNIPSYRPKLTREKKAQPPPPPSPRNPCEGTTDVSGSISIFTLGVKIGRTSTIPYVGFGPSFARIAGAMIPSDSPPSDEMEINGQIMIPGAPGLGVGRSVPLKYDTPFFESLDRAAKEFRNPNSEVATNSFGAMSPQAGLSFNVPLYRFRSRNDSVLCH